MSVWELFLDQPPTPQLYFVTVLYVGGFVPEEKILHLPTRREQTVLCQLQHRLIQGQS